MRFASLGKFVNIDIYSRVNCGRLIINTRSRRECFFLRNKMDKKPNSAFMKPMTLSPELEAVVGKGPMPRSEVVKKLWEYIKKNGLQDAANKRNINADEKLKKVFDGKATVNMFEMTKLVSKHLS